MRIKDEVKQEAIIQATVKLVNEIGFVASSVAKIATQAGVSPATLYIYYANKEDLLVSTYVDIKKQLSAALMYQFDESLPFRDILHRLWKNGLHFMRQNPELMQYAEQFANTPYSEQVNHEDIDRHFEPIARIIQHGIEQKVIKNVPMDVLTAFIFYPLMTLTNTKLCRSIKLDDQLMDVAFTMAWDAIKF